jgi:hypothetical protein
MTAFALDPSLGHREPKRTGSLDEYVGTKDRRCGYGIDIGTDIAPSAHLIDEPQCVRTPREVRNSVADAASRQADRPEEPIVHRRAF